MDRSSPPSLTTPTRGPQSRSEGFIMDGARSCPGGSDFPAQEITGV